MTVVKHDIVMPDDVIIRKNELGNSMFIIKKGSVFVRPKGEHDRNNQRELTKGVAFGELSLIMDYPRVAYVVSSGWTDLLILNKDDFLGVLSRYPWDRKVLKEEARKRLQLWKDELPRLISEAQKEQVAGDEDDDKKDDDAPKVGNEPIEMDEGSKGSEQDFAADDDLKIRKELVSSVAGSATTGDSRMLNERDILDPSERVIYKRSGQRLWHIDDLDKDGKFVVEKGIGQDLRERHDDISVLQKQLDAIVSHLKQNQAAEPKAG